MGPNFLSLENRFVLSTPFARSIFSSTIAIHKICHMVIIVQKSRSHFQSVFGQI